MSIRSRVAVLVSPILLLSACSDFDTPDGELLSRDDIPVQDSTDIVFTVSGLSAPESVRFDPAQNVYFISNMNRSDRRRDGNGFISRISSRGEIELLRFATGTTEAPLHEPRGMYITGDTLWATDVDGLHAFNRVTGEQLMFIDFFSVNPGLLNDVAEGPDESLFISDTKFSRIYRVRNGQVSVAIEDSLLGPPNGLTLNAATGRFLLAPWTDSGQLRAWDPDLHILAVYATSAGGQFDGVECLEDGSILLASQRDSSIHVVWDGKTVPTIHTPGRPGNIGIDTRRGRVAVPYTDLNRVDVWAIK